MSFVGARRAAIRAASAARSGLFGRIPVCTVSRADLLQLRTSRWRYFGLVILLGIYLAQSVAASPAHSVTFDEQYHLTPGYVYLTQHDLRFHHDQNPPLFEAILAAPLLARSGIHLPIDHPAYQLWGDVYLFSDAFFWHSGNDPMSMVTAGRIMAALTGVLLGLLLFVWGKQLFSEAAGWIALLLFVFDPNFIGNAIPTLDLPDFVKQAAVDVPSPASSYKVYQLDATRLMGEKPQQLQAAIGISATYPITFENGLALAGYEILPPGGSEPSGELTINTYWRVTGNVQPPVTVFVHLLDDNGNIVAQDDRFGAAARMLEPGDLIVQRHPIHSETPLKPGTYRVAIGLYNPDTSNRFKTLPGEDRLLLGTVEVKP
jgi:hypothetical protein